MKKICNGYWRYLCLVVMFITSLILTKPVIASEVLQEDSIRIKQLSQNYFSEYFKALKICETVNYGDIIHNSELKFYLNKNSKFDITLNKKLNRTIKDIDFNIVYNNIEINNDECILDLDLNLNKKYIDNERAEEFVDSDSENHLLLLKKVSNKWVIENDVYNSICKADRSELKDVNCIKDKIKSVELSLLGIDERVKLIKSLKNNVSRSKRSTQRYDRNAAVRYAIKHACNYNPVYGDFSKEGGDCTNFVSQCLANAGIPSNRDGQWWFTNRNNYGINWIRVEGLHTYLTKFNRGTSYQYSLQLYAKEETISNIVYWGKPGDILQIRFSGKSRYGHSIIITGFAPNKGDIYYCGHSSNVNQGSFRKRVLEKSLAYKVRLIHITY